MDTSDKKRPLNEKDDVSQQPSKRPMQKLSKEGPLTQQDVVYFKKEAIWRQMNFYKLQASELTREIAKYEKRYSAFLAVHSLLDSWFKLVVSAHKKDNQSLSSIELTMSTDEIQELLDERRQTLVSLLSEPGSTDIQENILKLSDIVSLEAAKEEAELLQRDYKHKIDEMEIQLEEALKENDRKKSKTLKRIFGNNQNKSEESEQTFSGPQNGLNKLESGDLDQSSIHELENLKIELAKLKAGNESLEDRLKNALSSLQLAEQANSDFARRLSNLDDTDLNKSPRYLALLDQKNALAYSLSQITQVKEDLVNRLRQSEEKEGNYVKTLAKDFEEENHRLRELLAKAESDLVRVRTVRDELLGKQIILKSELQAKVSNEELVKANEVLNERLKTMEKQRQNEFQGSQDKNIEKLDKDELIKRLSILNDELKDIEKAFQTTRDINLSKIREVVDRDGLTKKLTIEKNKADQKYFASMRLKDSLSAENKILKSQLAKSQELVSKFTEMDSAYASKIDILSKNIDEYRIIKEGSIQENIKLQETIKKLTKVRELAMKEVNQLKTELTSIKKEKDDALHSLGAQKTIESELEAKLRATETLLTKYKQNNTSSILQEEAKQLEALRSITKCSVCSKNWKNMAITACGHVFCDSCVQERLAARLRRCPSCNKGFSSNDLLSIHL